MNTSIVLAFIAIALLVVIVDQITRVLRSLIALPDAYELPIVYAVLIGMGFLVCWQGNFDIFTLLGFEWKCPWQGWLITGAIMAGGSSLVGKQFKMVGLIPNIVSGLASIWSSYGTSTITTGETTTPEGGQSGDEYGV